MRSDDYMAEPRSLRPSSVSAWSFPFLLFLEQMAVRFWQPHNVGRTLPARIDYSFPMRCVLGFDGGGTKTDCVLMDETGTILARACSGPSNPSRVSLEAAVAALIDAAEQALKTSAKSQADIAVIQAGIAGVGAARAIPDIARLLKAKFPNASVTIDSDLNMSLAATKEFPSILVIAGTGSAVIGRDTPEILAREGGLGPILGDPGSAYDIGRKTAILALRQHLQGETSFLGNEVLHGLNCNWSELQERIRTNADAVLPKIFPIVTQVANQGDPSARAILNSAAEDLSELVVRVVERLYLRDRPFFLAKTGGVFGRSAFFDDHFDALIHKIAPNARIGSLPEPIAEFAVRTALASLHKAVKHAGD
jgi:N-acetylglucosamine kinase-like BadF-type ATPase